MVEYHREGLDRWDNAKVADTTRMFRCTLYDLCAWAGLFERHIITRCLEKNRWPIYLTIQWNRLRRFKLKLAGAEIQDAMAAKGFNWESEVKNEEEKAA